MTADRDRAIPEPGRLQMVADIQATLAAVDAVDREMGDLPVTFYEVRLGEVGPDVVAAELDHYAAEVRIRRRSAH